MPRIGLPWADSLYTCFRKPVFSLLLITLILHRRAQTRVGSQQL